MGLIRSTATPAVLAAAAALALAGPASAGTTGQAAGPHAPAPAALRLRPMPAGTVAFAQDTKGHLMAHVAVLGLTPGSGHDVDLLIPGRSAPVPFSPLTATSTGQADSTLTSTFTGDVPQGSRLRIHLGQGTTALAAVTIAKTGPLAAHASGPNRLTQVERLGGVSWGSPQGSATFTYSASSKTLTVAIDASGLTPGPHAAHIHLGSCRSQGPVKYALQDLVADKHGVITNAVQVFKNVTSPVPAHGWYLNIHQGNSSDILSKGQPTIFFRPLLCTNITKVQAPRAR